ncbi:MAG: phospholipase [Halieaceae bacterium MED-G27]|nr:MAG: phospholipase [Halieaceae bacterium MED-G27]
MMNASFLIRLWSIAALLLLSQLGQAMPAEFEYKRHAPEGEKFLSYRIYWPEGVDNASPIPLVVFLHGAGERGSDNDRQLIHGARDLVWYSIERQEPLIIIAPQVPLDERWVDVVWDERVHRMPEHPSDSMDLLMGLLTELLSDSRIDTNRVYLTGLSMGGFGTWDLIARWPDTFAAALPVCGGGDTDTAVRIKDIPIWAFHGSDDTVVIPERSRDMIQALQLVGSNPRYTEYPGVGHDSWTETYQNFEVLDWFFSQRRGD